MNSTFAMKWNSKWIRIMFGISLRLYYRSWTHLGLILYFASYLKVLHIMY